MLVGDIKKMWKNSQKKLMNVEIKWRDLEREGKHCLKMLVNIFNKVWFENKLPDDQMLSFSIPIYKEKCDLVRKGSYRDIKLLDHAFKLCERIIDKRLMEVEHMDKLQYGFMPGRETADAVFLLRRLTEKFRSKEKKLFYVFVGQEKVFD